MSSRQAIFTMEQPGVVEGNFARSFSLIFFSISVHISGSIRLINLTWESLERSFPSAEVEYRWCQFWSKVMTSEVKERPRLVTAGYGLHRSQWINITQDWLCFTYFLEGGILTHLSSLTKSTPTDTGGAAILLFMTGAKFLRINLIAIAPAWT